MSVERSSLSLVELFEVVEAVEAIPATEGFLPPGVENPPPIDDPQLRKAMKEFLTRMLLSSRRLPSRWRTTKGLQTKIGVQVRVQVFKFGPKETHASGVGSFIHSNLEQLYSMTIW